MFEILGTLFVGLIVGFIARALKPGDDKLGFIMTAILGVAGSFLASYAGAAMGLYKQGDAAGWIAAQDSPPRPCSATFRSASRSHRWARKTGCTG